MDFEQKNLIRKKLSLKANLLIIFKNLIINDATLIMVITFYHGSVVTLL